jgi:hypothetical protein
MSTEYERQRQLTILKNKDLLNGLSITKPSGKTDRKIAAHPPQKRRKVEGPVRSSLRLANQPRPSHVNEDDNRERRRPTPAQSPHSTKAKSSMACGVRDMVKEWGWQGTAEFPTREETATLHFDGFNDVTSSQFHAEYSSSRILLPRRFFATVPSVGHITDLCIQKHFQ